jgi:hypothetical protein
VDNAMLALDDNQAKSYPKVCISGFLRGVYVLRSSQLIASSYRLCISDSGDQGLAVDVGSVVWANDGIIITGVRTNTTGLGVRCDGRSYIDINGPSAGQGAILSGNKINCQAWGGGMIRRWSIAYDDAVTTSASPTVNTYNTNVNSFIEA